MPDGMTQIVWAVAALVLAGGALAYGVAHWRRRRREAAAEFYHFRCPNCRRRLRFQSRQVGHKGGCSHCGQTVTFPPISKSVD
jgi:hypothetical protein